MNILFRVDSSYKIGSGHLMRCITLADRLRKESAEIRFLCRDHDGDMSNIARNAGYEVSMLAAPTSKSLPEYSHSHAEWLGVSKEEDATETLELINRTGSIDWLIVDHYAIDISWEQRMRAVTGSILAIDDLADRKHDCDILLDQNLNDRLDKRYSSLVPKGCQLLCGPKYALLRPQFLVDEYSQLERNSSVQNLLIFFGEVDATGETLKTCRALLSLDNKSIRADVIAGPSNPQHSEIKKLCDSHPQLRHHAHVENMAAMMAKADLAVGAGGTTTWERAWLGLPTIIIVVAENQIEGANGMAKAGAAWNLGLFSSVDESSIADAIGYAIDNQTELIEKSKASLYISGNQHNPGIEFVVKAILERHHARA